MKSRDVIGLIVILMTISFFYMIFLKIEGMIDIVRNETVAAANSKERISDLMSLQLEFSFAVLLGVCGMIVVNRIINVFAKHDH